jgi:quercetin dioxygenase-like cupin family protein
MPMRKLIVETSATGAMASASEMVVTPVAKTSLTITGQPIVLPGDNPEVTVSILEVAPGAALPQHRHPHPRYGYILSGQLRVKNADTGMVYDFHAGDFAVESRGQWHSGENPGHVPLKLLVIDQAPAGVSNIELKS